MEKKIVDSIIDGHKLYLHPNKEAIWNINGDCYPIHIELGITNRCNQRCIFCALDFINDRGSDIDRDVMLSAFKDMAKPKMVYSLSSNAKNRTNTYYDKVNSVMFGGEGEPTLHKDLGLFVQKAKSFGLDVALTTNGIKFDKRLQEQCLPYLSWMKFSIDAGTQETYSKVHGTKKENFNRLLDNIESSVTLKKEKGLGVTIGTQYLMIPQSMNKKDLRKLISTFNEIRPDYLSIKPYSDHPLSKKDLIVAEKDYNKIEKVIKNSHQKNSFKIWFRKETIKRIGEGNAYPECYASPFISLIDAKGNILPCNLFYGNEEFIYGNLYKESFSKIWTGEKRREVLSKLKKVGTKNCRAGCRCDAGNRYLHRIKNPEAHDNFT